MGKRLTTTYPDRGEVRRRLDYNPETGEFRWKSIPERDRSRDAQLTGKLAGGINKGGYHVISFGATVLLAHRLAWIWANGDVPDDMVVDHINRDKADNRLCNLRLATNSENSFNKIIKRKSGLPRGVYQVRQRFEAAITINGVRHRLGTHDSVEAASAAYLSAAVRLRGDFIPPEEKSTTSTLDGESGSTPTRSITTETTSPM